MAVVKHRADTWAKLAGLRIMDPDGWRDGKRSLFTPITKKEFKSRLEKSTVAIEDSTLYLKFYK